ncbi:dihydrolipoamide acetyltransferase family protein [Sunxiuqinia elliptica]|uniref:Dihydrolipoamide acetyltransferase component of pyruvate dehydrogenase complex n=1 Tax=Sunxiuqinia elliptica TaxID=655355 RepID=A0A4R6H8Z5_9BACT|nr:dihydrolipoamide acetyltransferase family protein [Sunxiuqinia elliptica]TDO04750.1 pyruvate dehydrogenase E2 component (dihydrolipoamide acetyltransferase) [Sunxiuqinia elliptica]TDO64297.1 pyruvate dehydrogenase E2 component (dihydrolipoamide acetyltransferase) [Sunxiuqinia elliptica]
MASPVIMPRQGQSVETCIIGQWYKAVGEQVKVGDILFSYETDKASFEEEAKEDGELLAIFYEEGDEVPVLVNVAVLGKTGESVDEFRPGSASREEVSEESEAEVQQATKEPSVEPEVAIANEAGEGSFRISPRAKVMAEKLGVPVSKVKGTGPQGRIIARDIEQAAAALPQMTRLAQEKAATEKLVAGEAETGIGGRIAAENLVEYQSVYGDDFEVKKLSNMRKLIAKSMHQSLQNSAQLTHHMSADARRIMALRKQLKAKLEAGELSQNITINDLVCYAVIQALKKFPQVNTHFLGDSMRWFKKVHLGLAVDTDRGLMVPAIQQADDLSLEGLSSQLAAVAAQCRKGNVNPELLKPEAASFTVSNLGNYGVEMFTPVINLPQTAILGVCTIVPRPKDLGDGVYGFVPMMGLSLTYDHQALDGGEATLFLREIKEQIENLTI